jgi:phage-related protein
MSLTLTAQYSFSFNDQVFGGAGSPFQIQSVDGLEGVPPIRAQDDNRGYADGMFSGRDFYAGRTISIILLVLGSDDNSAQVNLQTLQRALLPQQSGTTPLYFALPHTAGDITQVINARVRAFQTTIDPNYTYGYIVARVEFFCPNPSYFNANSQTALLGYFPPTGRVYNRVYNLVYDPATLVKTTTISNNGWATTYPVISLNGPIDNPILGNETTNEYLNFTVSMDSADVLVVDLYNKLITLNGVSARNLLTSGVWFAAPPGNSIFTLEGDIGSTVLNETVATIEFQSAYI